MPDIDATQLPFEEAIDYFASKTSLDTDTWRDTLNLDTNAVFTVAAAKGDLLQDIKDAVTKAQSEGISTQDFLKRFDAIADRYSPDWLGKGNRAWRGQLIYEQNIRQSHAAGRNEQMSEPSMMKLRPYWQWRHGDSRDPRPSHLALDGMVFDAGKVPMSPPCGFNCRCQVFSLSRRDLVRKGLEVSDLKRGDEINGIVIEPDEGFDRTIQKVRKDTLNRFDPVIRKQVEKEIGTAEFKLPAGSTRRRNGVNYVLIDSRWNRADDQTNPQRSKAQRSKDIEARTLKFKDDMENSSETYEQVAEVFIHDLLQMGDRDWSVIAADKIDVSGSANEQSAYLNAIEFYQLTNKELGVRSISGGTDRAFADDTTGSIGISDRRSINNRKSDQFHEMAHFGEFKDKKQGDECKEWVKSRATGELTKLSEITGLGYRDSELAYPDRFIDPYVGKVYDDNSTEVLSTGIECFANPKALADFYQTDPSHFDLIMKYIRK